MALRTQQGLVSFNKEVIKVAAYIKNQATSSEQSSPQFVSGKFLELLADNWRPSFEPSGSKPSKGDLYRLLFIYLLSMSRLTPERANSIIAQVFANGNVGAVRNQTTANNSQPLVDWLRRLGVGSIDRLPLDFIATTKRLITLGYTGSLDNLNSYISESISDVKVVLVNAIPTESSSSSRRTPRATPPAPATPPPATQRPAIVSRSSATPDASMDDFKTATGGNFLVYCKYITKLFAANCNDFYSRYMKLNKRSNGLLYWEKTTNQWFDPENQLKKAFAEFFGTELNDGELLSLFNTKQYKVMVLYLCGGRVSVAKKIGGGFRTLSRASASSMVDDLALISTSSQRKIFDTLKDGWKDVNGNTTKNIIQAFQGWYENVSRSRGGIFNPINTQYMIFEQAIKPSIIDLKYTDLYFRHPELRGYRTGQTIPSTSSITPTPTPPAPATATATQQITQTINNDPLIRDIPFDKTFGVEWEHFGLNYIIIKDVLTKLGQRFYRRYVPTHTLPSDVDLYPNRVANKGEWALQIDGSVSPDSLEPSRAFFDTKAQARDGGADGYNTYYGELVSPVLGGKRGLAIVKTVGNALVSKGMRHNKSTGMHVHMDKQNMTIAQVKNLICNYIIYEPIIEGMFELNRRGTGAYNTPFRDRLRLRSASDVELSNYVKQIQDMTNDQFKSSFGYTKQQPVNLLPYYGKYTIEFRSHGGNYEGDTVPAWVLFLHFLMEFSKKKMAKDFTWYNMTNFMPVPLATFWYNRIQDLTGKSPYALTTNARFL